MEDIEKNGTVEDEKTEVTAGIEKTGVTSEKKKRVWEIDALRGFLILFVIFDHLMWDFGYLFRFSVPFWQNFSSWAAYYYSESPLRQATHGIFIGGFVLLSGISTHFSKNNFKKALKVLFFAFLLTWLTAVSDYTGLFSDKNKSSLLMAMGVLHMLGFCGLLYAVIELLEKPLKKINAEWWQKIKAPFWFFPALLGVLGVMCLVIGYRYNASPLAIAQGDEAYKSLFAFLVQTTQGQSVISPGDYLSLFPWLGYFLIGAGGAKIIYKEKKSLLPKFNEKYVAPLSFCGRNSLWFYLGGQVAGIALLSMLVSLGVM